MHKRKKAGSLLAGLSILSVLVLLLSACGAQGTPTTSTSSKPVKGGVWVDDLPTAPDSLLPNGSVTTYSAVVDQALYAPLFYGDSSGVIHAGIASEIPTVSNGDVSADLKTWTFKLLPHLKWSDGQPLNADDIDFTWKLYNNPKYGAKSDAGFNSIASDTISADKLTITFHLSTPQVAFDSSWVDGLTGGLLPRHVFQNMAPDQIQKSSQNLMPTVVNGPFVISPTGTQAPNQYTMVPNKYYYQLDKGPYLDKLVFTAVDDANTILKNAQSASITSSWFIDISELSAFKAVAGYSVVPDATSAGYEALWLNENNPALKDLDVRKAIAMAINHQQLITVARSGLAQQLCTDHPASMHPGYQANAQCPTYDVSAANSLLQSDGWVLGSDGIRARNGVKLSLVDDTTQLNWRKQDQLLLQQQLKQIGVSLTLKNYDGSTFFSSILPEGKPGVYDIGEFEQTYTYDADDSAALSCAAIPSAANQYGGENYAFWCNKQADALFNAELGEGNPTKRQDDFNQLHALYLSQFPFITLYAPVDASIVKNTAHNYAPGPMGAQETVNVWQWWCTNGKC